MQRKKVLLLFGGRSSEHDVSVLSARNVYAAIDDERFDVELCYIDKTGRWWLIPVLESEVTLHEAAQLLPALGQSSFITIPDNRVIQPDVMLPILHGAGGEDGTVQGLAALLKIPIVGCDLTASSLGFNKKLAKEIARTNGIKVVEFAAHYRYDTLPDFNHLSMQLGCPMFVKPACAGSSVGVSKVYTDDELEKALEKAHRHADLVLIERGIAGRELEVAILGNPPHHKASSIGEIKVAGEFYNYDSKYSSSTESQVIIPAQIDENTAKAIKKQALHLYQQLGCKGLARVDFFLDDDGMIYFNEINTMPGFTNNSMYPKLWRHDGVPYVELIDQLIKLALGDTIDTKEGE